MKKIMLAALVLLLVSGMITGCNNKSDYQRFMQAMQRTEAVEKGKTDMEMVMKMTFNKEGLPEEVVDFMEIMEELKLSLRDEFDKEKGESLKKIFVQTKDMGIDAKMYTRGDIAYVITPIIPKILVVEGEELVRMNSGKINGSSFPKLSRESVDQLKKIWEDLYSEESVSAIEDIVLDTPEGRVKARKFEVRLRDEQLKPVLRKSMEIFMQDKQLVEGLKTMMGRDAQGFSVEKMFESNLELLDQATINSFSQVAYIDRDNYVIDEKISIDITFHFTEPGTPQHYSFNMTIKRWDLNREPQIHFPEITADNSITLDQLREEYPEVFRTGKGEKH